MDAIGATGLDSLGAALSLIPNLKFVQVATVYDSKITVSTWKIGIATVSNIYPWGFGRTYGGEGYVTAYGTPVVTMLVSPTITARPHGQIDTISNIKFAANQIDATGDGQATAILFTY